MSFDPNLTFYGYDSKDRLLGDLECCFGTPGKEFPLDAKEINDLCYTVLHYATKMTCGKFDDKRMDEDVDFSIDVPRNDISKLARMHMDYGSSKDMDSPNTYLNIAVALVSMLDITPDVKSLIFNMYKKRSQNDVEKPSDIPSVLDSLRFIIFSAFPEANHSVKILSQKIEMLKMHLHVDLDEMVKTNWETMANVPNEPYCNRYRYDDELEMDYIEMFNFMFVIMRRFFAYGYGDFKYFSVKDFYADMYITSPIKKPYRWKVELTKPRKED